MMYAIFFVFGLSLFINNLGEKLGFWSFLMNLSGRVTVKLIFDLLQCRWCLLFHTGTILTIIYGLLFGFDARLLTLPFINAGLLTIKIPLPKWFTIFKGMR